MAAEDSVWLFDAVTGFLRSPDWAVPVWNFIDDNCIVFDSDEENKLAYHDIFNAFREMVESLLQMFLSDMGKTMEAFVKLCTEFATTDVGKDVLEQILAVDDYSSFKQMMVKRNMELELESMRELQVLSEQVKAGEVATEEVDEDASFEAQLQAALAASMKDLQNVCFSTDISAEEISRMADEAEDADLRMALALSLQIEKVREEKGKAEDASPTSLADAPSLPQRPQEAAAPPAAKEGVLAEVAPASPSQTSLADAPSLTAPARRAPPPPKPASKLPMTTLAPIQHPPIQRTEDQQLRAERAIAVAQKASARAAEVRERDFQEREEREDKEPTAPPAGSTISQAEMRARAEHLRKQRDLILAKRKAEREGALGKPSDWVSAAPSAPAEPSPAQTSGSALNLTLRAAGYSSAADGKGGLPEGVDSNRAALSRALASSMKASLIGGDASTLELQQRIDSHQRKADLERIKEQLKADASDF